MRILGIDPGYGRIGWGVIEGEKARWKPIAYGCIETSAKKTLPERLLEIEERLTDIIDRFQPQKIGIEELFFKKNVTTGLKVAHARGVMMVCAQKKGISIVEIKPTEIKMAVTGYGNADKKQVQTMVLILLGIKEEKLQDDAADALAAALTITNM